MTKSIKLRWTILIVIIGLAIAVIEIVPRLWRYPLEKALQDPNPAVRVAAIRKMRLKGNESLLIDALNDENPDVRLLAAEKLGWQGPKGDERARALTRLLNDDHLGVRREAARALGRIGPDAAPAIQDALSDDRARVRAGAALALSDTVQLKGSFEWPKRDYQAIIPFVEELKADKDDEVRKNAEEALSILSRNGTEKRR